MTKMILVVAAALFLVGCASFETKAKVGLFDTIQARFHAGAGIRIEAAEPKAAHPVKAAPAPAK